jgi:hypothetical protein
MNVTTGNRQPWILAIAFLAFLACPAGAGTITYRYYNMEFYDPGTVYLVVDEAALTRGEILPGDVRSFSFFSGAIRTQDLAPVDIPISTETGWPTGGWPTGGGPLTASREMAPGVFYNIDVTFGEGLAYWHSRVPGSHDLFGYGYWTVDLQLGIVPEPSGLALACVALACVGGVARWRPRAFPGEPR